MTLYTLLYINIVLQMDKVGRGHRMRFETMEQAVPTNSHLQEYPTAEKPHNNILVLHVGY